MRIINVLSVPTCKNKRCRTTGRVATMLLAGSQAAPAGRGSHKCEGLHPTGVDFTESVQRHQLASQGPSLLLLADPPTNGEASFLPPTKVMLTRWLSLLFQVSLYRVCHIHGASTSWLPLHNEVSSQAWMALCEDVAVLCYNKLRLNIMRRFIWESMRSL